MITPIKNQITQIKPQGSHLCNHSKIYVIIFCLGLLVIFSNAALAGEVKYTSQNLRDPFQSPFEIFQRVKRPTEEPARDGLAHLRVQGLVWGTEMPQAIINNIVVRVGEIIEGAEVLDILKEGVYVSYEGKQYILRPVIK